MPAGQREDGAQSSFLLARWIYLRLLGIVFAIAFASLGSQADGLIGSAGILPAAERLASVAARTGTERYAYLPTFFWLGSSDLALDLAAAAGVVLALALCAGFAPRACLLALWALYLSFDAVSSPFLSFQWDALLLETSLLAVWLAPGGLWQPGLADDRPPSRAALWLQWWLLLRLMLGSGAVKLASGDPHWRDLTAMSLHYETQPLPNPLSWYVHHLPAGFHSAETAAMFAVELVLPFAILAGRIGRGFACAGFVALQVAIGATGNYGFFNLLTAAIAVLLLDDRLVRRVLPARISDRIPLTERAARAPSRVWAALAWTFAGFATLLSGMVQLRRVVPTFEAPQPFAWVEERIAPFGSVNAYGLFAVMTTYRHEIVFEGSEDGRVWRAYGFRYKPDDPAERPCAVQPHMPRLDWQLWFASLSLEGNAYWVQALMERLLEGSPAVLDLLAENPFPNAPPKWVRAVMYDVHFSSSEVRERTGDWWERRLLGVCVRPMRLRER